MSRSNAKRILVIEDEDHIAEGLKLNLELKGYTVRIAPDGIAALQDWKEWQPDLIVLDIMLPGIDGLSVLRNIRLEDTHIPILILSAKGDPEDRIEGFSHGVDDYLAKPSTWKNCYFGWIDSYSGHSRTMEKELKVKPICP